MLNDRGRPWLSLVGSGAPSIRHHLLLQNFQAGALHQRIAHEASWQALDAALVGLVEHPLKRSRCVVPSAQPDARAWTQDGLSQEIECLPKQFGHSAQI
jgi:hypothetical protein